MKVSKREIDDLLDEVDALNRCGYREEEIAEMLGERWPQVLKAMRNDS